MEDTLISGGAAQSHCVAFSYVVHFVLIQPLMCISSKSAPPLMQDFLSQRLCKLECLLTAAWVRWRKTGQNL